MSQKSRPNLIIWDLDGTLVNSLPSTLNAFNDGLEPYLGRRMTFDEIMSHFGPSEEKIIAKIVGEELADECYQKVLASTAQRLSDVIPHDGILDALDEIKTLGYRFGIFTGRGRKTTDIILDHLGLRSRFEEIVTNTEVEHNKPHPEGIYKICKKTGIPPSQAIMVGDSPMDIQAGRTAGTLTVGCAWDELADRDALGKANANHVLNHPSGFSAWLTER
ncbi:MAG: HAD family hydrolase [Bdellovibrionota bacterium]